MQNKRLLALKAQIELVPDWRHMSAPELAARLPDPVMNTPRTEKALALLREKGMLPARSPVNLVDLGRYRLLVQLLCEPGSERPVDEYIGALYGGVTAAYRSKLRSLIAKCQADQLPLFNLGRLRLSGIRPQCTRQTEGLNYITLDQADPDHIAAYVRLHRLVSGRG